MATHPDQPVVPVLRRSWTELVLTIATTEYRMRYANSRLGFLWALAKPLMLFGVLYVVFARALKFGAGIENFPLMLLLGVVLWSLFSELTSATVAVFVSRADLLRKVAIPPITLVVATSLTAVLVFVGNMVAVLAFTLLSGVTPTWSWLEMIPLLVELAALSFGLALCLSVVYTRMRDIGLLWEVALQMLFYATPVIYPITLIDDDIRRWILVSPLAQIFQQAREAMYGSAAGSYAGSVDLGLRIAPLAIVVVVVAVGITLYVRRWRSIVEEL